MIKSVLNASDFMMKVFHSKGPQFIYQQFNLQYKLNYTTNSIIGGFGNSGYSPTTITTTTSDNISTTPTSSTGLLLQYHHILVMPIQDHHQYHLLHLLHHLLMQIHQVHHVVLLQQLH